VDNSFDLWRKRKGQYFELKGFNLFDYVYPQLHL
jgi:hypothetical protein